MELSRKSERKEFIKKKYPEKIKKTKKYFVS